MKTWNKYDTAALLIAFIGLLLIGWHHIITG
jgi:hypothetical protein